MASSLLANARAVLALDPLRAARLAGEAHAAGAGDAALLLRAAALRRAGEPGAAAAELASLAARTAGAWGVHFELGLALASAGESGAAIASLDRAVALNPASMLARHARRDLKRLAGDDDAEDANATAAVLRPELAAAVRSGDAAALAGFGLDPRDIAGACVIAEVADRIGRQDIAEAVLATALAAAPDHAPARYRRALALHRLERDEDAAAQLAPLPDTPPVMALRGAVLLQLGQEDAAERCFAQVVAVRPDAYACLAHGHALRMLGRSAEAVAAYRAAIVQAPTLGEAWWSIADLKTADVSDTDRATMRDMLASGAIDIASRSHFAFALGHAEEKAGDFEAAFAHYREGNALRRAIEPHDPAPHDALVAAALAALAGPSPAPASPQPGPPLPVFIVGMPRSGTSLVEQILASHSAVEGLGELPDLTAVARLAGRPGPGYLDRVAARRRTDRPVILDKFPGNWLHLPLLRRLLPQARIIDVRRDPRDCCVSLYAQSFAAGQAYSYALADLAHRYDRYLAVMDAAADDPRVLTLRYEALVAEPEVQVRRMLAHLGLAFEPGCLAFHTNPRAVRTASSEQVRRPLHAGAIGRWRRFDPWLGPLFAAFSPRVLDETQ